MKVYIKGKPYKSGLSNELIRKAVKFYMSQLLEVEKYKDLKIRIEFTKMSGDNIGLMSWLGDENRKPKEYEVIVKDSLSKNNVLKILAHEMVHVKQFATGEMYDHVKGNKVHFKGKSYSMITDNSPDYYFSPWEIEAYGREVGLYRLFMLSEKNSKK
jgi:hypothetical protein